MLSNQESETKKISRIFNALGNETRVKIILLVKETKRPLHIKAIAQILGIDYAALYRHVQVLDKYGIVEIYNVGRSRVLELKNADVLNNLIEITKTLMQ